MAERNRLFECETDGQIVEFLQGSKEEA